MLYEGDEEEETAKGQSSLMVESPKLAKPEVGVNEKMEDAGPKDPFDAVESLEDIAKD